MSTPRTHRWTSPCQKSRALLEKHLSLVSRFDQLVTERQRLHKLLDRSRDSTAPHCVVDMKAWQTAEVQLYRKQIGLIHNLERIAVKFFELPKDERDAVVCLGYRPGLVEDLRSTLSPPQHRLEEAEAMLSAAAPGERERAPPMEVEPATGGGGSSEPAREVVERHLAAPDVAAGGCRKVLVEVGVAPAKVGMPANTDGSKLDPAALKTMQDNHPRNGNNRRNMLDECRRLIDEWAADLPA